MLCQNSLHNFFYLLLETMVKHDHLISIFGKTKNVNFLFNQNKNLKKKLRRFNCVPSLDCNEEDEMNSTKSYNLNLKS